MIRSVAAMAGGLVGALAMACGLANEADAAPLRAGAATSNVTPPLGTSINGNMHDIRASQVHDELHARCLVLDDGATALAFAIVDSCMIPDAVVGAAKRQIEAATGLRPDRVMISATHTHSAACATPVFRSDPDLAYQTFLATRIADGVARARLNLAPARVGWGVGRAPEQVFNRRWRMKPGTIPPDPFGGTTDQVRMNPPAGTADLVEPAGPTDPDVTVLAVRSLDGRPIALLANYSLHYVGDVGPAHISADYFGAFADRVQALLKADRLDPPFVAMMSNGTSGNINNMDFRQKAAPTPPYTKIRAVGDALAAEVARVADSIEYHDTAGLAAAATTLPVGVRLPSPTEVEAARAILAKAEGRNLLTLQEIYARETVKLADYPPQVDLTLQAFRVGDLGIAAIPCEVFVEIGLELKAASRRKPTFAISLANGYHGYLPTPEHHALGGYETWRARSSYLEAGASPRIVAELLKLLDAVGPKP